MTTLSAAVNTINRTAGPRPPAPRTPADMPAGQAVAAADRLEPADLLDAGMVVVQFIDGRGRVNVYDTRGSGVGTLVSAAFEPGPCRNYGGRCRATVAAELVRRLCQDLAALALEGETVAGVEMGG